jgi:uncharacterized protein (DUF983 family)
MLARALLRRCLRCGSGGIFCRWVELVDACPGCGAPFAREEGYWIGALIVNTGATQLLFFAVFLGGMWATWPDVPWNWLLAASLVTILVFPIVFYPWAKTLWLWLDHVLHPAGRE